jgi:adenosylcobinamide-phosphate synthase
MDLDEKVFSLIIPLVAGYLLDLVLGDPRWVPHPVKGFGWMIAQSEKFLNQGKHRFWKGMLCSLFLLLLVYGVTWLLHGYAFLLNKWVGIMVDTSIVYLCLANRSLIEEGKAVFCELGKSPEAGRKRLSWIVGRDTASLTGNQVRTAVFETMSENLSDGVLAPLFYYALGGAPAMMAYKMVNTLDSMIGYKNDRYRQFGCFAARLDDVANFFPARITAILMVLVTLSPRGFIFICKYGHKHNSPNSGYPEAALAGILNCRFGGPNYYHGQLVVKPYIGDNPAEIKHDKLSQVIRINHFVTLITVVIIVMLFMLV